MTILLYWISCKYQDNYEAPIPLYLATLIIDLTILDTIQKFAWQDHNYIIRSLKNNRRNKNG